MPKGNKTAKGKKRAIKLRTLSDISRYLNDLINRVERGELECEKASKLTYIANILSKTLKEANTDKEIEDLQKEIKDIETRIVEKGSVIKDNIYEYSKN